jgi:ribosome-binding protein aMBF1 (putative translation factor)
MVNRKKQARLKAAGWRVGTAAEFLGLTTAEALFVEIKLALADAVRERRGQLGLTQAELGERMGSSQSRVAKLEAADRTVSIDLLLHALVALGCTRRQVARILGSSAA